MLCIQIDTLHHTAAVGVSSHTLDPIIPSLGLSATAIGRGQVQFDSDRVVTGRGVMRIHYSSSL
jgi:hypothetical protein